MFGFGKKPQTQQQQMVQEMLVIPENLNVAHSYAAPNPETTDYPAKEPYGVQPYSDQPGPDFPNIKNQDEILTHWFRPPADVNPQPWYDDRNEEIDLLHMQEIQQTKGWQELSATEDHMAPNPWLNTPKSPRPTSTQSPSNYRFVRPFDQKWARTLNGQVGSLASLDKAYALGSVGYSNEWRNTLRNEPTRWDIEQFDLSATSIPAAQPGVVVSPAANQATNEYWDVM